MALSSSEAFAITEGTIGFFLSVLLLTIFIYRLWQYRVAFSLQTKQIIIQFSLLGFCILQSIHWSFYLFNYPASDPDDNPIGYTAHLLSIVFLIFGYMLFISLWGDTLRLDPIVSKLLILFVIFFALSYFGLIINTIKDILQQGQIDLRSFLSFKISIWYQAGGFVLASLSFFIYGVYARSQMEHSETWDEIYRRLNLIMLTCTICTTLRVCMLVILMIEPTISEYIVPTDIPVLWYTLSQWIPFFGLLIIIQYITRKRGENSTAESEIHWTDKVSTFHTRIDEDNDYVGLARNLRKKRPQQSYVPLYGEIRSKGSYINET